MQELYKGNLSVNGRLPFIQ